MAVLQMWQCLHRQLCMQQMVAPCRSSMMRQCSRTASHVVCQPCHAHMFSAAVHLKKTHLHNPPCICCALSAVLLAVALMSLRAQLQAPPGNTRPIIAATLNADQMHDSSRCNAVLWAPRSNGSQFLACHASGSILVYKKVR